MYFLDVGKPLNFQNIAKIERLCLRIVEHFLNPFIDEFIRNRNTVVSISFRIPAHIEIGQR